MPTPEDLQKLVNASGFLFQLRVESEVQATRDSHQWQVLAREHPWYNAESGKSGYIDLILDNGPVPRGSGGQIRLVIECKRTSGDAAWVFLAPDVSTKSATVVRTIWAMSPKPNEYRSGWLDSHAEPASYLSEFCDIRGKGEDQVPMLERISQKLLDSTESLAFEEIHLYESHGKRFVYLPVVVTNADLQICKFQSRDVSLLKGTFDNCEFESVPLVRFHKSLATKSDPALFLRTVGQSNQARLRTVLIVKADYLSKFLEEWCFDRAYSAQWDSVWYR